MIKKIFLVTVMVFSFYHYSISQVYRKPNCALKSHETLDITQVEVKPKSTIVNIVAENRRESGGYFCADRKISIISSDGSRLRLIRSKGIPICPETHKFNAVGEKLEFSLEFPPLKPGTKWVDIIEECSDNCFWFYGVTLDNELNTRLDEAFSKASGGSAQDNYVMFKKILDDENVQSSGIKGLLYINIINAAMGAGNKQDAAEWYRKMLSSDLKRLDQYIKYLNDSGIKF